MAAARPLPAAPDGRDSLSLRRSLRRLPARSSRIMAEDYIYFSLFSSVSHPPSSSDPLGRCPPASALSGSEATHAYGLCAYLLTYLFTYLHARYIRQPIANLDYSYY